MWRSARQRMLWRCPRRTEMTAKELLLEAMRRSDAGELDGFVALQAPDCTWITPAASCTVATSCASTSASGRPASRRTASTRSTASSRSTARCTAAKASAGAS